MTSKSKRVAHEQQVAMDEAVVHATDEFSSKLFDCMTNYLRALHAAKLDEKTALELISAMMAGTLETIKGAAQAVSVTFPI